MKNTKFKVGDVIQYKKRTKEVFVHMLVIRAFQRMYNNRSIPIPGFPHYDLYILNHHDIDDIGQYLEVDQPFIDREYEILESE